MKHTVQIPWFQIPSNSLFRRSFVIFFALFLGLSYAATTWAATYTVTSWRGNVKINNQTPVKNVTVFTSPSQVKFNKTSDYVLARDQNGELWAVTPRNFSKKESDGTACTGSYCKPTMKLGAVSSLYIVTVNSRGIIAANDMPIKNNDRITLDSRIAFSKTSDFLVVKLESGEMMLIRPKRFEEDERLAKTCTGPACQTVQEPIEVVKRKRPAFYEQYIKPLIKP